MNDTTFPVSLVRGIENSRTGVLAQASLILPIILPLIDLVIRAKSMVHGYSNSSSHHLFSLSQPQSLKQRTLLYLLNIIRWVICIWICSLLIFFNTPSPPKLCVLEMVHLLTHIFRLLMILLNICYTATEQLWFL